MESRGLVVISLDTELAWGFHGYDREGLPNDGSVERAKIGRLLKLFDEFGTPVTWAVVGHLFLDSCDGIHDDLVAPMRRDGGDWYATDPGTDVERNPLRYAPDVVDDIQSAAVDHEIASHTFSHVVCSEKSVSKRVLQSELEHCRMLAADQGLDMMTLVFPRNEVRYRSVLADEGFSVYRGKSEARRAVDSEVAGGVRRYLRFLARRAAPQVEIERDDAGVWNLPASQRLSYNPGSSRVNEAFRTHPRVSVAKRTIQKVANRGGIYHLWDHPHAFTPEMFRDLRDILQLATAADVDVVTIREAVRRRRQGDA